MAEENTTFSEYVQSLSGTASHGVKTDLSSVHRFNVAADKSGANINYAIYCWVA